MLLNRAKVGLVVLMYSLNLPDYGFMGADCLFHNSLVKVYQSSDLGVAPTGIQHKEISEGKIWQCLLIHNVSKGRMKPRGHWEFQKQ